MTDILDLKGWTVLGRTEEDGADVLEAEYPQPTPTVCPICGTERSVSATGQARRCKINSCLRLTDKRWR